MPNAGYSGVTGGARGRRYEWEDMAEIATLIGQAQQLCLEQRFGEADRLYADVLKADPRHTSALLQRARLAVGEGRLADARSLLEAIQAIEPNHAPAI